MYNPISCEFFDQLNVAMQRKIPSTIVYLKDEEQKETLKGIVKTMEVIDGIEFMVLDSNVKIRLDTVLTFNGKRHKEE
ncbi:transcriptional antiterminator Rof [Poseidonibacter ostreae]|jgi:Rho-binding antiterminator|uniref:Transcriptional antiterminator Rof n=1 Tax=Poseidonibacter ostreae TaxID=2654171 RepID=A0A6L4WRU7_9BACT|nr:transcriptional antiterminator Rof [Poseidonibacter ostreae]KAB7885498.1 transcriptional antiterminator Rof [Poseidonibacter ostreae]KAB7888523.1 transcriptional antiterminator Rof [Poseidonibacter ostreae]KAB7890710.1 transcriptional antiterminator Rof [Poseidonibacter ostreae]MAC84274.1 transcriptional antiterminator Rof [Arcobacter sp.]|tara:strand:- start:1568 stop:1801 length:234 start_codon:yes stop_codon:yes gene_type:complete